MDDKTEKEMFKAHPVKMSCIKDFTLGFLLLPILIGTYFLGRALIHIYTTDYIVTNKRIVVKSGILTTRRTEVRIADVRGVDVTRSLWQRMIGAGTVSIGTAATAGVEIYMVDVPDPQKIVDAVISARG